MNNKLLQYGLILTMSILLTAIAAVPAAADYSQDGFPVVTRTTGTINGSIYINDTDSSGGSFDVPDGTVLWARLYTGVWGGTAEHTGWENITFNGDYTSNGLGPIHLEGSGDTNPNVWCTGCGKYWIYYDVTNLVNPGSVNTATNTQINGTIYGPSYGTVLVVVFEGGDNPKDITYWINDGSDYAPCTTYFNDNIDLNYVIDANLTMIHLTAFEPFCSDCLEFNGHTLDTSMIFRYFEINTWNVYDYMASSGNNAWSDNGSDEYVTITNAFLILEHDVDEIPPYTTDHDPVPGDTWVSVDTDIVLHVRDDKTGVDVNTIVMMVEDEDVTQSVSITGTQADYTISYDPPDDFEYEQVVNVTVTASDLNVTPNVMQYDYSFTTEVFCSDLIITDIWEDHENQTICYRLLNTGAAPVEAGHNTTLYVDSNETAMDNVAVEIASHASYEGCFDDYTWTHTTPPEDNITVCADSNNTVLEYSETNNCLTRIWSCGDVDGENGVTMGDGIQLAMGTIYGTDDYPLKVQWAADVDCANGITMGDGIQIAMSTIYGTDDYPLNCCQ